MREIKFRAKHSETQEWWTGSNLTLSDSRESFLLSIGMFWLWVETTILIPETVRQYTGRKDKNGKEICEGDVALCPVWDDYDKGTMTELKGVIRWNNDDALFEVCSEELLDGYMLDNACNMTVISNES